MYKALFMGNHVAVKVFNELVQEEVQEEIELLFELRHPNIVGIFGWFEILDLATRKPLQAGIILELCERGELRMALKKEW